MNTPWWENQAGNTFGFSVANPIWMKGPIGNWSKKPGFWALTHPGSSEPRPSHTACKCMLRRWSSQLHLAYKAYYVVIAFWEDPYGDEKKEAELNLQLGRKILANISSRLK
jgi:hypothetical protein